MKNQKVYRTKNVTENDLEKIFEQYDMLEKYFLKEAKLFLQMGGEKGRIYTMDLFISAIINRAISLIRGFKCLADQNNYISAVPLIRIQVDNCLRFYAATLVKNSDDFFIDYLKGTHIRNMKDASGERMTDSYLVGRLDKELFPGIHNLYVNTSGYVHLSNEHSFLQTKMVSGEERAISTRIGYYDFFAIDEKVDFAFNMFKASEFVLTLAKTWSSNKAKIVDQKEK